MNLFDAVAEFSRAADVLLLDEPGWPPHPDLDLALSLIDEEAGELRDALNARDMVETADAISDLMYVTAGLVLRIGGRELVGNTDYLVDITHRVASWDVYEERWTDYPEKVRVEVLKLRDAVERREHGRACAYARQLLSSCALLAGILGLPMRSVFAMVQASNMSKVVGGKVIRNEAGKVQKPPTYMAPDVRKVLIINGWREAA